VQQVKLMLLHHNHNIRVVLVIVQVSLVVDQAMMVQDQENLMILVLIQTEMVCRNFRKQNQSKKQKKELKGLTTTLAK
jgi:hypothetical protein